MKAIAITTKGLIGKLCWGVEWESQLNLSMSFGKPQLRVREATTSEIRSFRERASFRRITVKGEWWLWVFCAYWKICIPGSVIATSSSPIRLKRQAMAVLSGQKLLEIHVNSQTGFTEFSFDLGAALRVRRFKVGDTDDIWTLYKPNGYVVGVRGDGTFTHAKGTTPGDRIVPIPMAGPSPPGRKRIAQRFNAGNSAQTR